MDRIPVSSSNISSIGYDSHACALEIEFNNGAVYQYAGVPKEEYDELMAASSHGQYFNANIKHVYSVTKL